MKTFFVYLMVASLGLGFGAGLMFFLTLPSRPDLSFCHLVELDAEVTAKDIRNMSGLSDYQKQEEALFRELDETVYETSPAQGPARFNRYWKGAWSDPGRLGENWNRTFELPVDHPEMGVLMLHGLSDSPYSLRALARRLHQKKMHVVGLRLPGHGTVPAGLAHVHWQDFTEAVRLAARDLKRKIGDNCPMILVGYSNGAALAVEYTLSLLSGEDLPEPAGMVLISPALAVSPMAALARWNLRLSEFHGLEKLAWLSIEPEFDPFKYNSFSVNAGDQIYRLTRRITSQIRTLSPKNKLKEFPPVLAFQSMTDTTIPPRGVVDNLLIHLPPLGHRLVLFDINRDAEITPIFAKDPREDFENLFSQLLPFDLVEITNTNPQTRSVSARLRPTQSDLMTESPLNLSWPRGIYSLSHVALPFEPQDEVYGLGAEFSLGKLEPRGEKDLLTVPMPSLMRLRYNPFFSYMAGEVEGWAQALVNIE